MPFESLLSESHKSASVREAGKDVVDGDAGCQFSGECLRPVGNGTSYGVGDTDVGDGFPDGGRDDVDDPAESLRLHPRDERPREVVGCMQQPCEGRFERCQISFEERP